MDEISKSYSISKEQQADASRFCQNLRRYQLSREGSTYVYLPVELDGHWAAVLIVITPCPHPQFRRQLIFTPRCRYTLCCRLRPGLVEDASRRIGQTIRDVFCADFPLGGWDFLDPECYARDPGPLDRPLDVSCVSIANEALRRYANKEVNGTSEESVSSSNESSHSSGVSLSETAGENLDRDQTLILKVQNIEKGLKALHLRNDRESSETTLPSDGRRHSYMYYAEKLQEKAKELGLTKRTEVWWHCYLSGSVSVASRMLPAQPAELVGYGFPRFQLRR
ncbi:MAG: hypothetical protein M1840_005269 [Geoglossum simile]|nr:MAG: hypothetical protein M1840_005269 [Geoglossum simile]